MEDEVLRCKYRRDFCVLILRLIQSPDLNLLDFRNLLTSKKYTLPKTVLDSFDQTLADMNELGVGKLLDIVDSLDKILSHSDNTLNESKSFSTNSSCAIAKSSVIGKFFKFSKKNFIVYFIDLHICISICAVQID